MKRNTSKIKTIMLSVFTIISVCLWISHAAITGFAGSIPSDDVSLSLNSRNTAENVAFQVQNMLPGDTVSGDYNVEVTFENKVTVHFATAIQDGYDKMAEVLKVKVRLTEPEEKLLYDGLMKDMPESLIWTATANGQKVTEALHYEISAYLDTSVGNEYQGQKLAADFEWWAVTEEAGGPADGSTSEDSSDDDVSGDSSSDSTGSVSGDAGNDSTDGVSGGTAPTGDAAPIVWLYVLLMGSGLLLVILCNRRNLTTEENATAVRIKEKATKLYAGIAIVIMLVIGLAITTAALVTNLQEIQGNLFETGTISINLNDGKRIIGDDEIVVEPGMTIEKNFFIENDGTCDVYFKIYAVNVDENELADMLEVIVKDGEEILYTGKLSDMIRSKVTTAENVLEVGAKRELSVSVHFPEESGNALKGLAVNFDINADAVQSRNNPDREF